jgi:glycosyltransferase involved in cell wall biosynthesis
LKKANIVIVPSLQLKHLCEKWGVNVQRLVVIRNSVDTEKFKLEHEHQKKYDFVTVCRLVPWKGVAQIIECAKILNASLLIIGDGPERSNLEKLASGSHSSIDLF